MNRVAAGRGAFLAMAGVYALGVFNDNFFKQAACLIAVRAGRTDLQGWVAALYTAPFLLAAAPAGWLADRFPKGTVVRWAKALELAAMLLGAWGILAGSWVLLLGMAFTMGLQSCLFSPALNGAIPEHFPADRIPGVNGALKGVVSVGLLAGAALGGVALSAKGGGPGGIEAGRGLVAAGVVAIALLGVLLALGVPSRSAAARDRPFPWSGPLETLAALRAFSRDRMLITVILADTFIWSIGALLLLLINVLALEELGAGEAAASALVAAELAGIGLGGLAGGRLGLRPGWQRQLPFLAAATGLCAGSVALLPLLPGPWRLPVAGALLALTGAAGGAFMIPCESFLQIRPPADRKGAALAAANFAVFAGIVAAGPISSLLVVLFQPSAAFGLAGLACLPAALWLRRALSCEGRESP